MNLSKRLHTTPQRVLIVGLGFRTGLTSANFLAERGHKVTVSDMKSEDALSKLCQKLHPSVVRSLGSQEPSLLDKGFDLVVLSPGVPATIPLIAEAHLRNIPVIAEVELAYYFMKGRWLGITGTDGKSTTTALTNFMLKCMCFDSREGGNIGIPLISLVSTSHEEMVTVAELSSFQLETIDTFTPDVAALLNLAPDHLDRYPSMDEYLSAKLRIAKNFGSNEHLVYNLDDPVISREAEKLSGKKLSFSILTLNADAYLKAGSLYMKIDGTPVRIIEANEIGVPGLHNIKNSLAALLLVYALCEASSKKFSVAKAAKALRGFQGLSHRLEHVGDKDGVAFINDSKATTVNALMTALDAVGEKVIVILGGRAKGEDYSLLAEKMQTAVKAVVLIGETKAEFSSVFSRLTQFEAETMEEAVRLAYGHASAGDTVLLSPGCTSFDMYDNYEKRGDDFRAHVHRLMEGVYGS